MPKHVTSHEANLPDLAPGKTIPKKHRSDGEPLATMLYIRRPIFFWLAEIRPISRSQKVWSSN